MNARAKTQFKTDPNQSFTHAPTNFLQRKKRPGCQDEECRKKRKRLQRKPTNYDKPSEVPPIVHEVLRSPGHPLDQQTRSFMEPHFGHDFSRVRVHTDNKAAESARSVNAKAYTVGQDVVFGAGQYAASDTIGKQLLAHELTHVLQHDRRLDESSIENIDIGPENDTWEREAQTYEKTVLSSSGSSGMMPHAIPQPQLLRVSLWQGFLHLLGLGAFPHEELQEYLRYLDQEERIESGLFSNDKAREVVDHWKAEDPRYILPIKIKVLLIKEMLNGVTWNADEQAVLELLSGSDDNEILKIVQEVGETRLREKINGEQLNNILKAWRRRMSTGEAKIGGRDSAAPDPEQRLLNYLRFLDVNDQIEQAGDSHLKARKIVRRWKSGDERYYLPVRRKQLLVEEMLTGETGTEDKTAILEILKGANDVEISIIVKELTESRLRSAIDGDEGVELEQLLTNWRTRSAAAKASTDIKTKQPIEKIVVNQEMTQTVTVHWKGGGTDTDICSTGKGHCCVEEKDAAGAACSEVGSKVKDSECTPVGEHTVQFKIPLKNTNVPKYWTEFVHPRDIALHEYEPRVDGTPLSHGCVRLREPMARMIYEGSENKKTKVIVKGLARPRCNWPALQAEWAGDFRKAGSDPKKVQKKQQSEIEERRRILQETYDISEEELIRTIDQLKGETGELPYPVEIWKSPSQRVRTLKAITPVAEKIPRCVPTETVEERRLSTHTEPEEILAKSKNGFDKYAGNFKSDLDDAGSFKKAQEVVRKHGGILWEAAVTRAGGGSPDWDDRLLYWPRLQMMKVLRNWTPKWLGKKIKKELQTPDDIRRQRATLIALFETTSRGMASAVFSGSPENKRILISGFDPFGLHQDIECGNPSGAAVLALDGSEISAEGITAEVQGVVFPVRFADFNAGMVERFFRPQLTSDNPPHMIMTISQGVGTKFEVERFAARARSLGGYPGNIGQTAGGSLVKPVEPPGLVPGPEFLETTLPKEAIRHGLGRTAPLKEETEFMEIRPGESRPVPGGDQPSPGATAVEGSGGGFLSNEVFYRTLLLRREVGSSIPVGHLHTPYLEPPGSTPSDKQKFRDKRDLIVREVKKILISTLPKL
jgi:pyrrolidone-carboxylate peptidase